MKGNLDYNTIKKELELIFLTPQFVNSEKEKKLLDYLVKKTMDKEYIKEAHVAIDVFKKDGDFDPSLDSTVRVYIGKLRNKLEKFYLSDDSQNSSIVISIPKGHYEVNFEFKKRNTRLKRLKFISSTFIFLTIILLTAFVTHLIEERNNLFGNAKVVTNNPIWKEYSKSEVPTLIVVGDFFFMSKIIDDKRYIVRDAQINSQEEFEQNGVDTLGFSSFDHTYSPSDMAACITSFIPHLINTPKGLKIKQASLLTWDDINSNNIIFVGEFKTLYILNRLLPKFNIEYDLSKKSYFLNDNNEPIHEFDFDRDSDGFRNEHIIVTKRPGVNNNTITLILTLGRGGIDDVSQKLTDPDFLKEFTKKYRTDKSKSPFYFDLVFKISGVDGTSFSSEVVYFKQINI